MNYAKGEENTYSDTWDFRAGDGCARSEDFEGSDLGVVVFNYLGGGEDLLDQALPRCGHDGGGGVVVRGRLSESFTGRRGYVAPRSANSFGVARLLLDLRDQSLPD